MSVRKKIVIFDLDNTLCDSSHRAEIPFDRANDNEILKDKPIVSARLLLWELAESFDIAIVTARADKFKTVTRSWLRAAIFSGRCPASTFWLLMKKPDQEGMPDHRVKGEIIDEFCESHGDGNIFSFAVDDDLESVKAYQRRGIIAFLWQR